MSTTLKQPPSSPAVSDSPGVPLRPPAAPAPSHQQRVAWSIIALLVVGYAVLSHYSESSPDAKGLGAALSIGPVALIAMFFIWRWTHPAAALLLYGLLGAALYQYWPALERNYVWGDLAQQCGAYALVAASFARSLFGGRVPLCTQLASAMHGELTPAEVIYTRGATRAWTAFYALLALAILVLFFTAPLRIWSLFVNFATFGLIFLMGLADHLIRQRIMPRHSAGGLLGIIRRSLIG